MPDLRDVLIREWEVEFDFDEVAIRRELLPDAELEFYEVLKTEELHARGAPDTASIEFRDDNTTVSEDKLGTWQFVRETDTELTLRIRRIKTPEHEETPSRYVTFIFDRNNGKWSCYDSLSDVLATSGFMVIKSLIR